ncbi:XK-related domain containing protein 1 [Sarcoptes scabiei]|uniref:XK-related protein n=1 Tax=Sarcoptes scabiei TaxID=52283 RepID=A0A132A762_SARSC|nr:XK-related domain containing protein 1 [Sarcoptes scabiei]
MIDHHQQNADINCTRAISYEDDHNTNIYTEPTIVDVNIDQTVETGQSTNFLQSNHSIHFDGKDRIENNHANESFTIVGENMSITLNQGRATQTLFDLNVDRNSAVPNGSVSQHHKEINPSIKLNSMEYNLKNNQNIIIGNETEQIANFPQTQSYHIQQQQPDQFYLQPQLRPTMPNRMDFLPLCDLLFNIISLAAYFCDVVFDLVTAYTLYLNRQFVWCAVALCLILTSIITTQILSFRWYLKYSQRQCSDLQSFPPKHSLNQNGINNVDPHSRTIDDQCYRQQSSSNSWADQSRLLFIIHCLQCGVLWRYFKLFAPVDLITIKLEVSELCILRMLHAFLEASPMLLLQTYLVWRKSSLDLITDLNIISIFLSLFSICWALSSFNKNIRVEKIHKLVLTWFGVIFQFLWRIGTITSRIVALTVYAVLYKQWLFVVIILHWFSMFLWLMSPHMFRNNIVDDQEQSNDLEDYHRKKQSKRNRFINSLSLAWVYVFCYVNMDDSRSRYRLLAFYATMFLENILLLSISMFFDNRLAISWYSRLAIFLVIGCFLIGLGFMWIYYRFFHIRNLKYSSQPIVIDDPIQSTTSNSAMNDNATAYINANHRQQNINNQNESLSTKEQLILNQLLSDQAQIIKANKNIDTKLMPISQSLLVLNEQIDRNRKNFNAKNISAGVFSCRLNPALKRKKKKPSTIPPLPFSGTTNAIIENGNANEKCGIKTASEIFSENFNVKSQLNKNLLEQWKPGLQSKNLIHQIQRPMTNSALLENDSSDRTRWNNETNKFRSISISPSMALMKSDRKFRTNFDLSNRLQSTTTPSSMIFPAKNFTDKLIYDFNVIKNDSNRIQNPKKIIRPKPIMQQSINLDSISEINLPCEQFKPIDSIENEPKINEFHSNNLETMKEEETYNYYEYLNSLEKSKKDSGSDCCNDFGILNQSKTSDVFMHRRPPVPGRESRGGKITDNDCVNDIKSRTKWNENGNQNQTEQNESYTDGFYQNIRNKNQRSSMKKKRKRKTKLRTSIKINQKYRSRTIDLSGSNSSVSDHQSNHHSSKSNLSSSGGEGDIESDVNHHPNDRNAYRFNNLQCQQNWKNSNKNRESDHYDQIEENNYDFNAYEGVSHRESDQQTIYGRVETFNRSSIKDQQRNRCIKSITSSSSSIQGDKFKRYHTPL